MLRWVRVAGSLVWILLHVTLTKVDVTLQASTDSEPLYVVEVLLHCSKDSVKDAATEAARPAAAGETGEMQVSEGKTTISTLFHDLGRKFVTLQCSQIAEISSLESRQSILRRSNLKWFQSVLVLCHQLEWPPLSNHFLWVLSEIDMWNKSSSFWHSTYCDVLLLYPGCPSDASPPHLHQLSASLHP